MEHRAALSMKYEVADLGVLGGGDEGEGGRGGGADRAGEGLVSKQVRRQINECHFNECIRLPNQF